ncbi:hypothetical protein ADL04_09765 [Streptomyces sp. NRRL B-3648]|nr:hypothetical protein ADL04_09765 [Streptomyces sp. NRRL B-3648]
MISAATEITRPAAQMRPPSTQRTATQPVFPSAFTFTQSFPDGPPDQHLYEPPLLFRVHGVVVQGILASGSVIEWTTGDEGLADFRTEK